MIKEHYIMNLNKQIIYLKRNRSYLKLLEKYHILNLYGSIITPREIV